jgi:hypothetical protein
MVLLHQFFGLVNFVIKWRYSRKLQSKSLITWAPKDSKVFGNTKKNLKKKFFFRRKRQSEKQKIPKEDLKISHEVKIFININFLLFCLAGNRSPVRTSSR